MAEVSDSNEFALLSLWDNELRADDLDVNGVDDCELVKRVGVCAFVDAADDDSFSFSNFDIEAPRR